MEQIREALTTVRAGLTEEGFIVNRIGRSTGVKIKAKGGNFRYVADGRTRLATSTADAAGVLWFVGEFWGWK